jgi:hypothetical protein
LARCELSVRLIVMMLLFIENGLNGCHSRFIFPTQLSELVLEMA